jgi:hypothetical protein
MKHDANLLQAGVRATVYVQLHTCHELCVFTAHEGSDVSEISGITNDASGNTHGFCIGVVSVQLRNAISGMRAWLNAVYCHAVTSNFTSQCL